MKQLAPRDASAARRALLRWFRRKARPLPWRASKDPYLVWVSEVMLQQTQVAAVIPYYLRFIRAFPSVETLAAAPLERVLEQWSGLGYYRRARHLHQAARIIVAEHEGQFPSTLDKALELPGVGEYTARASLSIAFNRPHAALDGNIARVIARLLALRGNLHQARFRRAVERQLIALLSRRRPGNFNQALMEIGQTLCLPRRPRCARCPLRKWCRAHRLGRAELFPQAQPRRARETRYLAAALIRQGRRVLLVRGLDEGLLPDLWNLPSAFGRTRSEALRHLHRKLRTITRGRSTLGAGLADFRHTITYRSILGRVYPVEDASQIRPAVGRWMAVTRLKAAAVSQVVRKLADLITR